MNTDRPAPVSAETVLTTGRYSCRKYSTRIPSPETVNALLEAAHMAPSACNRQPWRLMLIEPDDTAARNILAQAYDRQWFVDAPYHIVVYGVESEAWVRPFDNKNHMLVDASIITEHICLLASAMGLGSCWICNFDPAKLQALLPADSELTPVALLPIGFPADDDTAPAKKRKPLDEILIKPCEKAS